MSSLLAPKYFSIHLLRTRAFALKNYFFVFNCHTQEMQHPDGLTSLWNSCLIPAFLMSFTPVSPAPPPASALVRWSNLFSPQRFSVFPTLTFLTRTGQLFCRMSHVLETIISLWFCLTCPRICCVSCKREVRLNIFGKNITLGALIPLLLTFDQLVIVVTAQFLLYKYITLLL